MPTSTDAGAGNGGKGFISMMSKMLQVLRSLFLVKWRDHLMVNVVSRCGYTYQYECRKTYKAATLIRAFIVAGFPANNFGNQEPGTNEEIQESCSSTYGTTPFPIFRKLAFWATTSILHQPDRRIGGGFPGRSQLELRKVSGQWCWCCRRSVSIRSGALGRTSDGCDRHLAGYPLTSSAQPKPQFPSSAPNRTHGPFKVECHRSRQPSILTVYVK